MVRSKSKVPRRSSITQEERQSSEEEPESTPQESGNIVENTDSSRANRNVSDPEEDEAPESISLSTSKGAAVAQRHEEQEAIDLSKEKEKQRRRNRDELLKSQKEMRQAREKSRISDDILKQLAEKQESKTQNPVKDSEDVTSNVHVTFDDGDDDDNDGDEKNDGDDGEKEEQRGLQLMVLNQTNKNSRGVLNSANEFLENHFYGDRLNRVDTLQDHNRKRKNKNFGPAIKFSKTDI